MHIERQTNQTQDYDYEEALSYYFGGSFDRRHEGEAMRNLADILTMAVIDGALDETALRVKPGDSRTASVIVSSLAGADYALQSIEGVEGLVEKRLMLYERVLDSLAETPTKVVMKAVDSVIGSMSTQRNDAAARGVAETFSYIKQAPKSSGAGNQPQRSRMWGENNVHLPLPSGKAAKGVAVLALATAFTIGGVAPKAAAEETIKDKEQRNTASASTALATEQTDAEAPNTENLTGFLDFLSGDTPTAEPLANGALDTIILPSETAPAVQTPTEVTPPKPVATTTIPEAQPTPSEVDNAAELPVVAPSVNQPTDSPVPKTESSPAAAPTIDDIFAAENAPEASVPPAAQDQPAPDGDDPFSVISDIFGSKFELPSPPSFDNLFGDSSPEPTVDMSVPSNLSDIFAEPEASTDTDTEATPAEANSSEIDGLYSIINPTAAAQPPETEQPEDTIAVPETVSDLDKIATDIQQGLNTGDTEGINSALAEAGEVGEVGQFLVTLWAIQNAQPASQGSGNEGQPPATDGESKPEPEPEPKPEPNEDESDAEKDKNKSDKQVILDALDDLGEKGKEWKNRAYVVERMVKAGYTVENGMAFAGRFVIESGGEELNPAVKQYGGGPGRGIAQWGNSGTSAKSRAYDRFGYYKESNGKYRHGTLRWYAEEHGKEWDKISTQMDFVLWELENTEKGAAKALRKAGHDIEASVKASLAYERPASWLNGGKAKKTAIAETLSEARKVQKGYYKEYYPNPSSKITPQALQRLDTTKTSKKIQDKIVKSVTTAIESSRDYPVDRFSELAVDSDMKKDMERLGFSTSKEDRRIYDCRVAVWTFFAANGVEIGPKETTTTAFWNKYLSNGEDKVTFGDHTFKVIRNPKMKDLIMGDVLWAQGHTLLWTDPIKGKSGETFEAIEAAYASNRVSSFRDGKQAYSWIADKDNNHGSFVALRLVS